MGLIYCDGCIWEEDEKEDDLDAKACKPKVEFDKVGRKHTLILDVKLPFWNNLSIPYYIRFLKVNRHIGLCDTDLVERRESNPLTLFCRTTSLANIPIILSSSEVFIERFGPCRRTRSVNDLGDLFVEYPSAVAGSGDVMISSSARFDSAERTVMAGSLLKSSLFFQLGSLDGATRPIRATSFNTSPVKISDFSGSLFGVCDVLSQEPNSEITSSSSQISNLKASERLLVSCSSTDSTSSYQSNSSPCLTVSKGLLYCVWKNGTLNILFKEGDDRGKAYVANFHKIESSVDKALDYLYIFRSTTGNEAAEFVGKMKVSSSLILNSNRSKSVETEFVLFGVEDHSKEVHYSTSSAMKNKGFSKVSKIFRSNHSLKHKATGKIGEPSFQIETFFKDPGLNKSSDFDESKLVNHLENGFRPSLELAAIVVKRSPHCGDKDAETGGWGLKFLEKVTMDHDDTPTDPLLHSEIWEASQENSRASWMGIDVLIPAGFHGGPVAGDGGPSALTERWRSGGHCDCGGWDIGCPLTVFHDKSSGVTKAFPKEDSQESKTVDLFIEGAKHGEPALKMVTTSEGMYTMYFQPTLSALQAFSVGVGIIHSQTSSLHPKL